MFNILFSYWHVTKGLLSYSDILRSFADIVTMDSLFLHFIFY